MKKRILSLLLCVAMLLTLLPQTALFASAGTNSGTCGENLEWSFDEATGTLTITGSGAMNDWPWGSEVPWYSYCSSIKSVSLPDGLTSIGSYAFYGCTGLTAIAIPDSVTSIGVGAFENCTGLTAIAIPDSVTSIGVGAFEGCSGLTNITIPDSVTSIGWDAFYGCTGLTGITIPDSVTSIGSDAFCGCTGLTSITVAEGNSFYDSRNNCNAIIETATNTLIAGCKNTVIPSGVTAISDYAFYGCTGLTAISIPDSVTSICWGAFYGCTGLTAIAIPSGVTAISDYAFYGCTGLTAISIPDSVTSIGKYTFWNCTGLTSVTIGNGVTSIGSYAFNGCTGLTSITIPSGVTSIGYDAFEGCTGLTDVYYPGTEEEWNAIYIDDGNDPLTNATIHFGQTETDPIETDSGICGTNLRWSYNSSTYTLTITGSGSMNDWTWSSEAPWYSYSSSIKSVSLPDGLTSIGDSAFSHCTGLTSITIPSGVTSIGGGAFYGCSSLTSVYFCGDAPEELFSFRSDEWDNPIEGLKLWYQPGTEGWTSPFWHGYPTLSTEEGAVYEGVCEDGLHWCYDPAAATLTISGTGEMMDYDHYYMYSGYDVLGGAPWQYFGDVAQHIVVEEGVTGLGNYAFYRFDALEDISLPSTLTRIGFLSVQDTAYFNDESNWTDGVLYIGDCLIYADRELSGAYEIKDGTTVIAEYAFGGRELPPGSGAFFLACEGLSEITIPDSVEYINDHAFADCFALTDVYFPETEAEWNAIKIGTDNDCLLNATIRFGQTEHEHSYTATVTPPTCTEGGYTTYTCTCGDSYVDSYTDALGHNFADGVCSRCGENDPNYVPPVDPCEGYTDIDRSKWYHDAADFVIARGLMGSTKTNALTFEPNTKVSRAMVASILYRMEESPAVEYKGTFTDVPDNKWYTTAIEWCAQNGLASGKGNGTFDPMGDVTRQELAVFMMKMAEYLGKDTAGRADLGSFADGTSVPSWAKEYVQWAVSAGLISGKANGGKTYLAPTDTATRAEFASIIMRFVQNIAEAG